MSTFLEAYEKAKSLIDPLRKHSGNEEFIEAMDEIMGWAMDYYVGDAESESKKFIMGYEVGRKEAVDLAKQWLQNSLTLIESGQDYGRHLAISSTDKEWLKEDISKYILNDK